MTTFVRVPLDNGTEASVTKEFAEEFGLKPIKDSEHGAAVAVTTKDGEPVNPVETAVAPTITTPKEK